MSDPQTPNDPNAPQPERPDEESGSPFPESSLGQGEPMEPLPPAQPAPPTPPPAAPPAPSGFTSGDPLGGSSPAPSPPAPAGSPGPATPPPAFGAPTPTPSAPEMPAGYTSPPPPGAGGAFAPAGRPAPGSYRLGSWGARVGAAIIDGIIISVPAFILMGILGVGVAASDGDGIGALIGGLILTILVFAIVALLYAPVMMSQTNGKTVGRMVTGIRVIRANGQPITFGFAALREIAVKSLLVGVVSSFTAGLAYLVDVLWPLWDDENRALHDFVVDTRTIQD